MQGRMPQFLANADALSDTYLLSLPPMQLRRENGTAYWLKPGDEFECLVRHVSSNTSVEHAVRSAQPLVGQSEVRIAFTAQKLGRYGVDMRVNGRVMGGGTTHRTFIPGNAWT